MTAQKLIALLIVSIMPSLVFAYPYCPSDITGASSPCGANGSLTVESAGSITGDTLGSDGTTSRHFALSNPVTSSITIYGSVTNNSMGNNGVGLWNYPSTTLSNLIIGTGGSITGASDGYGIQNDGSITSISNYGAISGTYALNVAALASVGTLTNSGTIVGSAYGVKNQSSGSITSIINSGSISSSAANSVAISNNGAISLINNSGTISGKSKGIGNTSGTISSIVNSGTVSADGSAIYIETNLRAASIGVITNTGSLIGVDASIRNVGGTLTTLNNLQGAGNSAGALTYTGSLPTNYNIIIASPSRYGQLSAANVSGTTTFGIYSGGVNGVPASALSKGIYSSVLSGMTSSNLVGATSGSYNGFSWALNNSSAGIWDLIVTASTIDTQASLQNTASALQNTYTLQNSVLANSFSYDCNVFGANNVCISAGGRNTAVAAANGLNNTSALLIAGYRINPQYRIGAYADQNLSVNNAGSTVNLGNNTPLMGIFGAWQERLDGTGTEVKVSAAYGQKNATITRQVVGTSDPGTGSSQLNSQGAQVTAKYGFGMTDQVVVSPYLGMRYTQNNMGGYTEATSATVTTPLTYSALNTNATTALAGLGASYQGIPKTTLVASAGVESDTNTNNGTYSATGLAGLTPINFNANPVKTRPTASVGVYYDVEKNQRLGINGIYRQEPFQAVSTTTVMATYMIGM